MTTFIMKTLKYNIMCFTINIYSEDRCGDGTLYKHFLDIKVFGFTIFHTFWRTGDENDGTFYVTTPFKKGDCSYGDIEKVEI